MTKSLAMISGGLDSILAAKLIKEQGIDVLGICFRSYFFNEQSAIKMAKQIDIPLLVVDFSPEHLELVKNPKHGRGKNMNPCIDCHAMMMNYAGKLLEEHNADFIITGEVLNQRPMSQNRQALNIVKKESGFSNKILRPLCAKNIEPTEMELNGLVDREKLLDISGRSRKTQMELAEKWGITEYPSPAGGCKLTEPNYALRLRDLLTFKDEVNESELQLLRYGRHFRTADNNAAEFSGALVLLEGNGTESDKVLAARMAARYSKGREQDKIKIKYGIYGRKLDNYIEVEPISDSELEQFIISIK